MKPTYDRVTKSSSILQYPLDAIKESNTKWKNKTKTHVTVTVSLCVREHAEHAHNLFQCFYEFVENAANRKGGIIRTGQR